MEESLEIVYLKRRFEKRVSGNYFWKNKKSLGYTRGYSVDPIHHFCETKIFPL